MARRRARHANFHARRHGALWRALIWMMQHPQPVLALLIVIGSGAGAWHVVRRSPAFEVTTIQAPPDAPVRVPSSVLGQNLWAVDVHALARQLHSQYPQAKRIRVLRQPPHTLRIEIHQRVPLAQVQRGRQWHQVAGDGVVFSEGRREPWEQLTVLKGADELSHAVRLVKVLRRAHALKGRGVALVDVSRESELRFILDDGIEIRCGSESELAAQLKRLDAVLAVVNRHRLEVQYVDLRFQDPVIGPQAS